MFFLLYFMLRTSFPGRQLEPLLDIRSPTLLSRHRSVINKAGKPLGMNFKFLCHKVMLPDLGFKFYEDSNLKATALGPNTTTQETTLIIRLCLIEQRNTTPGIRR